MARTGRRPDLLASLGGRCGATNVAHVDWGNTKGHRLCRHIINSFQLCYTCSQGFVLCNTFAEVIGVEERAF